MDKTNQSPQTEEVPEEILAWIYSMWEGSSGFEVRRSAAIAMYHRLKEEIEEVKKLTICSNLPPDERGGLSPAWVELWSEIEIWYGDVQKKETAHQFLLRMQGEFSPDHLQDKQVMRWVKASEQLPLHKAHWITGKLGTHDNDFPIRMNGRYAMGNIYDQALKNSTSPRFMLYFEGKEHYENEFSEIEWLFEPIN